MTTWIYFTYAYIGFFITVSIVGTIIVLIGGIFDLKFFLKSLNEDVVDETDDGRVD